MERRTILDGVAALLGGAALGSASARAAPPAADLMLVLAADVSRSITDERYEPQPHPPGGPRSYYRNNVAGGPGGFIAVAKDFDDFGRALVRKLVQEIS